MAKLLHKKQTRHGYHGTDVYKLWASMVKRCENKSSSNYRYYGGRGISVCKEWRETPKAFCDWAILNGYKKGLELDRIDNNGNYEPLNCVFISHKENCAPNKRTICSRNKTGHIGIYISKSGKYEVYTQISGKQKYIGVRDTIEQALILKNEVIGNIHEVHNANN